MIYSIYAKVNNVYLKTEHKLIALLSISVLLLTIT